MCSQWPRSSCGLGRPSQAHLREIGPGAEQGWLPGAPTGVDSFSLVTFLPEAQRSDSPAKATQCERARARTGPWEGRPCLDA